MPENRHVKAAIMGEPSGTAHCGDVSDSWGTDGDAGTRWDSDTPEVINRLVPYLDKSHTGGQIPVNALIAVRVPGL